MAEALSLIRDPTGISTGISAILRDITTRKRAERELRRLLVDGQRRERWLGCDLGGPAVDARRRQDRAVAGPDRPTGVGAVRRRRHHGERGRRDDDTRLEVIATHGAPVAPLPGPVSSRSRAPPRDRSSPRAARRSRPTPRRCSALISLTPSPPGSGPLLLVPITTSHGNDGVVGVVRLVGRAGFSPEEIRVVESFGQQAGLAIELDRAQNDREQLAVMVDRERIARDLHDHVVQRLFAVGMALQAASRSIEDAAGARAHQRSPSRSSTPRSATCDPPSSRWPCAPTTRWERALGPGSST